MIPFLEWFKQLWPKEAKPAPAAPPAFGGGGATETWTPTTKAPRGIRNNNPGNIRGGTVKWQGEVGRDPVDFCIFVSAHYGLRALAKLLLTYNVKHGLDSVEQIIGRWAPTVENDTRAYANAVARSLGVQPASVIKVSDPNTLVALVTAIVRHENGVQPYSPEQMRAAVADAMGVV